MILRKVWTDKRFHSNLSLYEDAFLLSAVHENPFKLYTSQSAPETIKNIKLGTLDFLQIIYPLLRNKKLPTILCNRWPNLKNLSGSLNLSHGLNMVSST